MPAKPKDRRRLKEAPATFLSDHSPIAGRPSEAFQQRIHPVVTDRMVA
jgi:hypothetical protein